MLRAMTTAAALSLCAATASAQSPAEFYAGKSISLIISTGAGGGLDASARLLARHMGTHIPGKPTIVSKNMPGAGHVLAANYVYGVAAKDGTTIGAILPSFVGYQKLDGKGATYDAAKFPWLGSLDIDNQNLYVWHTTGVKTVDDVRKKEVLMGGTGAGSYTVLWPALMNNVLGTKFKIVSGYKSTKQIHLAMERGEVEGRAGNFFSSLKARSSDWLKEKKINLLVQFGTEPDPDFKDIPLLLDLAANDEQRQIFNFLSGQVGMGKAVLTTPGLPDDRLAALRAAFEATTKDPAYLAEAEKSNLGTRAASHEKIATIAKGILATPDAVVAKTREAIAVK
ncbi:MAG: hypothetical protein RLZ98_141 [Pseudomonadota bacterium]|jgi:tripartite-type tricarboxylate transporter receptor subunit TctC